MDKPVERVESRTFQLLLFGEKNNKERQICWLKNSSVRCLYAYNYVNDSYAN